MRWFFFLSAVLLLSFGCTKPNDIDWEKVFGDKDAAASADDDSVAGDDIQPDEAPPDDLTDEEVTDETGEEETPDEEEDTATEEEPEGTDTVAAEDDEPGPADDEEIASDDEEEVGDDATAPDEDRVDDDMVEIDAWEADIVETDTADIDTVEADTFDDWVPDTADVQPDPDTVDDDTFDDWVPDTADVQPDIDQFVDTKTFYCAEKPAIGTVWNTVSQYDQTWTGSAWDPVDDPTTEYDPDPSNSSCRYDCAPYYTWNGLDCVISCPANLILAQWTSGADDGWSYGGHWYHNGNTMAWGSTTSNSPYDHSLTYNSDIDLSGCAAGSLYFQVALADDDSWEMESETDKNQRLYVECSGDSGLSWNGMVAPVLPLNQTKNNGCANYYCDGTYWLDRSFSFVGQTWTTPSACFTSSARFRFRANGSTPYDLRKPGWTVDTVIVNY